MTQAASRREQRRLLHQDLSRNQLLDAAEEVFGEKGFHDTTLKEVAELAEFSVGSVYSFFENKDDLFLNVFLRRGAEFLPGMEAVVNASRAIATGDASIAIGGGVESMSRAPWVLAKPERGFPRAHETLHSTTLGWRLVNPAMPAEWTIGLGEGAEVPVGHARLARIGIAAVVVGMVADVGRVEGIEEAEGAVVDGQAQDAHVVCVHHAVAEPHGLPAGQQLRSARHHGAQQGEVGPGLAAAVGQVGVDDVVGQRTQQLGGRLGVREVLEMAEAHEAGRHPHHHGGGLDRLAPHRCVGAGDAQRARGRNAASRSVVGARV